MGQAQSGPSRHVSTEQLSHELAAKFAKRCFTPLELYSFQDVFHSLCDHEGSISYLKEDTITRFLELPDILGISSILFQMVSYLGAFPFGQDAPVVLGFEQMIMVVVIMTERYQRVLKKGSRDRTKLFFRSLSVYDKLQLEKKKKGSQEFDEPRADKPAYEKVDPPSRSHVAGFAVDNAIDDDNEDDDDDDLALAALEALDAIDVFKHDTPITQATIPSDNLRKIIMLLLLIAPFNSQESLSQHSDRLNGEKLEGLRRTADNVLNALINVEKSPGVKFRSLNTVIPISLPLLFNGFNPLFEHFLFSKNVDFTKRKQATSAEPSIPESTLPPELDQPLLPQEGEILDINVLSQLSFFIPGDSLFRQVRLLYSGGEAGFSMGSFETKVFKWQAPTILLVAGNRISEPPVRATEKQFSDTLPPKRFPDSSKSSHLVFGVYLPSPWKQTHKECIGDERSMLFQLEPTHEVFHASTVNPEYVSFTKPPNSHPGIGIGCPHPRPKPTAGLGSHIELGAVSLRLDAAFEFGVFTHRLSGGGAFHSSESRQYDWQDRFEIESLEVWGLGGDDEAKAQRERWAWEEREAEARRRINIGKGDIEADRALLEMAGIISQNRSGGSVQ